MKVSTSALNAALQKASKGVGNNKLIPLSTLIGIVAHDGVLSIYATDGTTFLEIKGVCENSDDFRVAVNASKFVSLISRLTCDTVSLNITNRGLEVVGNGKYVIEIPIDESGTPVNFPNPVQCVDSKPVEDGVWTVSDIQTLKTTLVPAVATTLEVPCYCNVYIGETAVATDTYKIAALQKQLLANPVLIASHVFNLLAMAHEDVGFSIYSDGQAVFKNDALTIHTHVFDVDEYAISEISALIEADYPYECVVSKQELLSVLDRCALFNNPYDNNAIEISFDEGSLCVSNRKLTVKEEIPYVDVNSRGGQKCTLDIVMLTAQIKAYAWDRLTIQYGRQDSMKLVNTADSTVQIISLVED